MTRYHSILSLLNKIANDAATDSIYVGVALEAASDFGDSTTNDGFPQRGGFAKADYFEKPKIMDIRPVFGNKLEAVEFSQPGQTTTVNISYYTYICKLR